MQFTQFPIDDFPFYRLSECSHQQLLYHSKYPVNIYFYKQTQEVFLVKQVPYSEKLIKLFRILKDQETLNIVQIRGLGILKYRKNERVKNDSGRVANIIKDNRNQIQQSQNIIIQNKNNNNNSQTYILIWMQKCGINLLEHVQQRRKLHRPFSSQQIKDFIFQLTTTLSILQLKGICHRDIKPQNILFNRDRYFLCDFDQCILTKQNKKQRQLCQIMKQIQYTTILYSSPKFLKALRYCTYRQKYFDPYKMDVYAFGLTLLFLCSLGKFNIQDRHVYMYNEDGSHQQFIQEERRKYVKNNLQLKHFNNVVKLMLEEDQYKRDDFVMLNMKIKNMLVITQEDDSENSYSEKSKKRKKENREKLRKSYGKGFVWGKYKKSQKFLLVVAFMIFLLYLILLIVK